MLLRNLSKLYYKSFQTRSVNGFVSLQLQLMFFNTEYGSYENAAPLQDGLAAISVFIKASRTYPSSK